MSYLGYTTKRVDCYPGAQAGPTVTSPATAWAWSSWVTIAAAGAIWYPFVIISLNVLEFPTAALDTRHQTVFQLGTGAEGAETPIVSIPVSWYIDSAVGHLCPWRFILPMPRRLPANARVAIRVAHSAAVASTFGPCSIGIIEVPYT